MPDLWNPFEEETKEKSLINPRNKGTITLVSKYSTIFYYTRTRIKRSTTKISLQNNIEKIGLSLSCVSKSYLD